MRPNKKFFNISLEDFNLIFKTEGTYKIHCSASASLDVHFTFNGSSITDGLVVIFSGAKKKEFHGPVFERWSWGRYFNLPILNVSDPAYTKFSDLYISWHSGWDSFDPVRVLVKELTRSSNAIGLNMQKIIYWGSSSGGFAAIRAAINQGSGTAVAVNPQLNAVNYYKKYYIHLRSVLTEKYQLVRNFEKFSETRLKVTYEDCLKSDIRLIYCQNRKDHFHYKNFFLPFFKDVENCTLEFNHLPVQFVYSYTNGHGAEPKLFVKRILKLAKNSDQYLNLNFNHNPKINNKIKQEDISTILFGSKQKFQLKDQKDKDFTVEDLKETLMVFTPKGRTDLPSVNIDLEFNFAIDRFKDTNWLSQLHKFNFSDQYLLNPDNLKSLKYLFLLFKLWYEQYIAGANYHKVAVLDFVVGLRLSKFLLLSCMIHKNKFFDEEFFINFIKIHLKLLGRKKHWRYTNHTIADINAIFCTSDFFSGNSKRTLLLFARRQFSIFFSRQFNSDGLNHENSFGYQQYGINYLKILKKNPYLKSYNLSIEKLLNKANKVFIHMKMPDGRICPIGDTNGVEFSNILPLIKSDKQNKLFESDGLLIWHNNKKYFVFNGNYLSKVHKQDDFMSLFWFVKEPILVDPGKYAYKSDKFRNYIRSAFSHNGLVFNRDNTQYYLGLDPPINFLVKYELIKNTLFIWGKLVAKNYIVHDRFIATNDKFLIVVDVLNANCKLTYDVLWNISPQFKVKKINNKHFIAQSNHGSIFQFFTNEIAENFRGGSECSIFSGWYSPGYNKKAELDKIVCSGNIEEPKEKKIIVSIFNLILSNSTKSSENLIKNFSDKLGTVYENNLFSTFIELVNSKY